jgi:signal transduction histidine kinase
MKGTGIDSALSPRLLGRLGASLFIFGGIVSTAVLLGPTPPEVNAAATFFVGVAAVAVGIAAWVVPWDRYPRALISLAPIALLVVALGNQYGGSYPYTYGIYFALVFGWIGLALGSYAPLLCAPAGFAAYLVPLALHHENGDALGSSLTVIPVCVLLGESVAWVASRLRRAEREVAAREQAVRDAYELEREASQRMQQLDNMKELFLQRVSHEFRTPLTSILGFTSTLERAGKQIDESTKEEMVKRLDANARRLERLLRDLLDLDRLARGAIELRTERVDMGMLMRRVVQELDPAGRVVHVSAPNVVGKVDLPIVERMVEHLLLGTIRQSPPGTDVWLRLDPHDGGVLLSSEQHAHSIPPHRQAELLKPFSDADVPASHEPGPGTDAALVARLAELHKGRAWVENLETGGTALRVFLPVELPEYPAAS